MSRVAIGTIAQPDVGPGGSALERFRALAERPPLEQLRRTDWRTAPPQVKRYPPAGRVAAGHLLGDVLRATHGLTRYQWNDFHAMPGQVGMEIRAAGRPLRPTPSGGGMASAELYVLRGAARPELGADAGAYHYDPAAHALDLVRPGATPAHAGGQGSAATVVVTSVFARLAFKYGEFGYRLQCLDAGAVVGQLLAVLAAEGLTARVRALFDEDAVHRLLGLDPDAEVALALVDVEPGPPAPPPPAGTEAAQPTAATHPAPALGGLPLVRALRTSRSLTGPDRVPAVDDDRWAGAPGVALPTCPDAPPPPSPRRRSPDGRLCAGLSAAQIAAVLAAAGFGFGTEELGARQVQLYTVARNVSGIGAHTAFRYDPMAHRLQPLPPSAVEIRGRPGEVGGYAAALYLVGDFAASSPGVRALGDRWYQVQLLAAGIVAQRAALGAVAAGVGARIQCSFDTDAAAVAFGLDGLLRPVCQLVLGPDDSRLSYQQRIVQ